MLNHGVPWQFVVTAVFIQTVFFIITLLGSLISGSLNWNLIFYFNFLDIRFYYNNMDHPNPFEFK